MQQPKKTRTISAMIALTLCVVVITVVTSTLVQQLLFGKTLLPVTVAVSSVSSLSMWWLLWKNQI